ncbi:hypothetical protein ACIRA0001_3145 [Acinetobacter radioresistens SK82]|uniref:Uncharacterized protein n=1 Tax=Acinetobacter radioresistens SK82 TaxID=596318 RepID=A0ABP2GMT7_ACIRA|nr:hypothetical protein ACIRA0001_3145 [Acinetobacter radioresistens SK82]
MCSKACSAFAFYLKLFLILNMNPDWKYRNTQICFSTLKHPSLLQS